MEPEFRYYPDLARISEHSARLLVDIAQRRVRESGIFTLVLSGGHTPSQLYENLSLPRFSDSMPWSKTHVFWGDERCVPQGSPDSNYAMARDALLLKVPLPVENVHRMPGETAPPDAAATEYEKRLRELFNILESPASGSFPSFDLILLGIGADGHTASLFPGDPAVNERQQWVVAVSGLTAKPPVPRITITLPVINHAKYVVFLVSGKEKAGIVDMIRRDPREATRLYPCARVQARERLIWFTDCRDALG